MVLESINSKETTPLLQPTPPTVRWEKKTKDNQINAIAFSVATGSFSLLWFGLGAFTVSPYKEDEDQAWPITLMASFMAVSNAILAMGFAKTYVSRSYMKKVIFYLSMYPLADIHENDVHKFNFVKHGIVSEINSEKIKEFCEKIEIQKNIIGKFGDLWQGPIAAVKKNRKLLEKKRYEPLIPYFKALDEIYKLEEQWVKFREETLINDFPEIDYHVV